MTTLAAPPLPDFLTLYEGVTIRVRNTRIPMEAVIHAHQEGASPETIVDWYDSLTLEDVYAVLGYYLTHRPEVEEYLRQGAEHAAEVRSRIEAAQGPPRVTREELLARRARLEAGNAALGQ